MLKQKMFLIFVMSALALQASTIEVKVDTKKADGKTWDALGGAPDIYIVVNDENYKLHRCQDTFECSFETATKLEQDVKIEVYDADASQDDFMGSETCKPQVECKMKSATVLIK